MPGYASYRLAAFLSRRLPAPAAYWVGLRVADLYCALQRRDREAVAANLRRIYEWRGVRPARGTIDGMTRKTFQHFGKYLVDFFRFSRLTRDEVDRRVSIERADHLEGAFELGRGVIVVTAHFGNWELGGAVLAALGYPVSAVVLPQRMKRLETLLRHQREERGVNVIPLGESAFASMRALRKGGLLALLADRDFTRHHARVPFFGFPADLPMGAAWLSERTGAPVVPAFLYRQEDDSFLLKLHRPIDPAEAGSKEAIMDRIVAILQAEIAERPYQWFIFRDFWRPGRETVPGSEGGVL